MPSLLRGRASVLLLCWRCWTTRSQLASISGALRVLHDQYPASAFAELGKHAKVVLDVGLNNGKDTEFFLRQGHAVVAVDANPQWVQAARARWASEIAARRLLVLCVGPRDTKPSNSSHVVNDYLDRNSVTRPVFPRRREHLWWRFL